MGSPAPLADRLVPEPDLRPFYDRRAHRSIAILTRESPTANRRARHAQDVPAREIPQAPPGHPLLTTRQAEVVELATLGLTNSQIAERLNVSTHAIKFSLASAYRKLSVRTRTQAAVAYVNYRTEGGG